MAWPCRASLWGSTIEQARADYATVANAIAAFEPVTMVANPGTDAADARAACTGTVEILELPIDDSWLRDSGPIYVFEDGERLALHFDFNAWGGKFPPWNHDAAVGGLAAAALGDRVEEVGMVLEGGSILSDGAGSLLTTAECLLNPNRNPLMSAEQIGRTLVDAFGLKWIMWLDKGLIEDRDTDGHVDLIAAFIAPGRVLLQTHPRDNHNYTRCEENRTRLKEARVEVVEMPFLPYAEVAGEQVAVGYLNFYICNGAVIVPVAEASTDEDALAIIGAAYPGREVIPAPGAVLAYGGGGPHCITQQIPAHA